MKEIAVTETAAGSETVYRLGKKNNFWMAFEPTGSDLNPTWTLQLTSRNRGGAKILAVLWESTALKPIGSVTIKGETYPLTIGWHHMKRGGTLCFGGERKTGTEGGTVSWEMQIKPADSGRYFVEMRLRSAPRREGRVLVHINTPLYRPEVSSISSAAARGHRATVAWSSYHKHAAGFIMLREVDPEIGWDENGGGYRITYGRFPFGGGKAIRFILHFVQVDSLAEARHLLGDAYAVVAEDDLHPAPIFRPLDPAAVVERYASPASYRSVGIERLYPKPPVRAGAPDTPETYYAGHPHYPLDMLAALWDWQRLHAHNDIQRLVRFGGIGLATDFQVMGRGDQPEPNKGAFWDMFTDSPLPSEERANPGAGPGGETFPSFADYAGGESHGIAANARIARALFLIHQATCEPLFRQSAVNICQWLLLKHNDSGYYSGERARATRGLPDDGKLYGDPWSLDGVLTIQAFVHAYRATKNEVYIKAARKISDYIGENWLAEREPSSPADIANVISSLLELDAEAPGERLRAVIREWGAALRLRPIDIDAPSSNYDGLHGGVFDCVQAAFRLHALEGDPDFLTYAFAALSAIPAESYAASPRAIRTYFDAMLSLVCIIPDFAPDFDTLHVKGGWRDFAPDQAASSYLKVGAPAGQHVDAIPLVSRSNDQMLLIVLAPPGVEQVTVRKTGKSPLLKDLLTDNVDGAAPLHPLLGETWARVGLFTIDP